MRRAARQGAWDRSPPLTPLRGVPPGPAGSFWADHNGYTLDLYNNYLAVFPDRKEWLLYDSRPVPFFFSLGRVLPREEKHMLASNEGNVRQYDAVVEDERKLDALKMMWGEPGYVGDKYAGAQWQRDEDGKVFTVPLITKLVTLVVNKFAILDPEGMGVEMEAGKPGWNDAMNGLPGLFGSETPTACELRQLLDFVGSAIDEFGRAVPLPVELHTFIGDVYEALDKLSKGDLDDFGYWDAAHTALETYREATAVTFKGDMVSWDAKDLGKAKGALGAMLKRSEEGLRKALAYAPDENRTIIPTYFRYEVQARGASSAAAALIGRARGPTWLRAQVTDYELLGFSAARKLPTVRVHSFEASALPLFLEGPTRHLKTMRDQGVDASRKVYEAVRRSTLHDKALQMYKISENLDGQPFEIGRMMAFDSGWLENESVWMHMSYKWYLEVSRRRLVCPSPRTRRFSHTLASPPRGLLPSSSAPGSTTSFSRRSRRGSPPSWTPASLGGRPSKPRPSSSPPPSRTRSSTARASSPASRAPPLSSSPCGTS